MKNDGKIIAFDIETNGLNVREIDIIGIGWHDGFRGGYVTDIQEMKELCNEFKNTNAKLLTWNGYFDIETFFYYFFKFTCIFF